MWPTIFAGHSALWSEQMEEHLTLESVWFGLKSYLFFLRLFKRPICGQQLRRLLQRRLQKRTRTPSSSSIQVQSLQPLAVNRHGYSTFSRVYICLRPQVPLYVSSANSMSSMAKASQLLRFVKIRYIVIGSAVAGGATLKVVCSWDKVYCSW